MRRILGAHAFVRITGIIAILVVTLVAAGLTFQHIHTAHADQAACPSVSLDLVNTSGDGINYDLDIFGSFQDGQGATATGYVSGPGFDMSNDQWASNSGSPSYVTLESSGTYTFTGTIAVIGGANGQIVCTQSINQTLTH